MHSVHRFSVLCILTSLALAAANHHQQQQEQAPPTLYTATVHHLPPSPTASPNPLATLTYHPLHPSLSHFTSFTPPPNTTDPLATTQIGVYFPNDDPTSDRLRTSATVTTGFYAPYTGRLRITVDPGDGAVLAASWRAWRAQDEASQWKGKGDFDIETRKQAPVVVFDKPTKGKGGAIMGAWQGATQGQEGEEEVVEKTFLQKYWWLLLGVAVLAMSGGGGDK